MKVGEGVGAIKLKSADLQLGTENRKLWRMISPAGA